MSAKPDFNQGLLNWASDQYAKHSTSESTATTAAGNELAGPAPGTRPAVTSHVPSTLNGNVRWQGSIMSLFSTDTILTKLPV